MEGLLVWSMLAFILSLASRNSRRISFKRKDSRSTVAVPASYGLNSSTSSSPSTLHEEGPGHRTYTPVQFQLKLHFNNCDSRGVQDGHALRHTLHVAYRRLRCHCPLIHRCSSQAKPVDVRTSCSLRSREPVCYQNALTIPKRIIYIWHISCLSISIIWVWARE